MVDNQLFKCVVVVRCFSYYWTTTKKLVDFGKKIGVCVAQTNFFSEFATAINRIHLGLKFSDLNGTNLPKHTINRIHLGLKYVSGSQSTILSDSINRIHLGLKYAPTLVLPPALIAINRIHLGLKLLQIYKKNLIKLTINRIHLGLKYRLCAIIIIRINFY